MDSYAYPGEDATSAQVFALAREYDAAARELFASGRRKAGNSAPARLCALHAIELYLSAYLLHAGRDATEVRGLQHQLAKRGEMAADAGLLLRRRTREHLRQLDERREYLAERYCPQPNQSPSPVNRLISTLDELASKTSRIGERPGHCAGELVLGNIDSPQSLPADKVELCR